jgi:lysophospholipase L1-like esterase
MRPSKRKIDEVAVRRLPRLAVAGGAAALVVMLLLFWLSHQVGNPAFWRAGLVFLAILEWTYCITALSLFVGVPTLVLLVLRGRRLGARRLAVFRAVLTVVSLAFSLIVAESIAAVRLQQGQRSTIVPVGGFRRGAQVDPQTMWPPVSLAEVPLPSTFPDPPGDAEIDLVVVGESSAEGVPYNPWLSIGRMVAWQLEAMRPGRPVRFQMVAHSGDTLELQHQRLARLTRRPDLMIVYAGHNEFSSRLNGVREIDHYLDGPRPNDWRPLERAEAVSAFCELIRQSSERCRLEVPPPLGHRLLIDVPAYTAAERSLLLADFRRRLDAIVRYAVQLGATVVLIVPAGNDAGFEPNRSFLPAATSRQNRETFRRRLFEAGRLQETDPAAAIAAYRALIDAEPGFAESHYRLAVLLDKAGDSEAAYRHFVAARDCDGYPIRCLTAFQDVCREVAARHDVIMVNGQSELHAVGRRGLLDDLLFQDAMHPSLRGQIALAQAVLRELRARHAFGWPDAIPAPSIDPAQCTAHFGLGKEEWKTICLWGVHFGAYVEGLRYGSALRMQRKKRYAEAYERLLAGETVEALGLPNVGLPEPVPAVGLVASHRSTGS